MGSASSDAEKRTVVVMDGLSAAMLFVTAASKPSGVSLAVSTLRRELPSPEDNFAPPVPRQVPTPVRTLSVPSLGHDSYVDTSASNQGADGF